MSGQCRGVSEKVNLINIYAPNDPIIRQEVWELLLNLVKNREGVWLIMGDFNEVRRKEERFSERVCLSSMRAFNDFIREAGLVDFNMGGSKFYADE